jgi:Pectate lyase superfamily protein
MKVFLFRKVVPLVLTAAGAWACPLWAAPVVFHCSESAGPGEIIAIQGSNFGAGAHIGVHRVLATDTSLAPDILLTPLYNTDQAITVQLPKAMPLGLYAIWVKDASNTLSPVVYINRARATGFEYAEVPGGYLFRIFGRNLCLPGATPLVRFVGGGNSYPATIITNTNIGTIPTNDANVLRVQAPTGINAGDYSVQVSNGYGHNTALSIPFDVTSCVQTINVRTGGTDVFGLGVPWGPDYGPLAANIIAVTTYGADPTGTTNSVNAIQQALYDAGNPAKYPFGATVYLPQGNYLIDHSTEATTFIGTNGKTVTQPPYTELVLPSNVVIKGDGVSETTIIDATAPMPYPNRAISSASTSPTLCGIIDLTYRQTCSVTTMSPPQIVVSGQKACLSNLNIVFAHSLPPNALGGAFSVANSTSHDVIVQNVTLDYGGFVASTGLATESNIIIRNNTFSHHGNYARTRMLMSCMENLLFEGNICSRDSQWPGPHAVDNAYEQGQIECDIASYVTILNNIFYAENPPLDSNFGSGETINSQGQPFLGTDKGSVTSATTTSLTDSTRAWPTNLLAGQSVSITNGIGSGQTAVVLSNTATTLTLTPQTAWITVPSGTSKYSVTVNSYDLGTVTSATSTTLTGTSANGSGFTYWPTEGTGLTSQIVAIVSGTGAGQWRTISSNTSNTLTITQPWDVIPSNDSHYSITGGVADHYLIKGNSFADQPRGVVLYTGSHDCTVVDNTFENTGMTVYIRSDQRNINSVANVGNVWSGRMNLSWDNQVRDNVTINSTGAYWPSVIGAVAYTNNNTCYGEMVVGTDFRRNVILSDWPNLTDQSSLKEGYSAIGYSHVFANVIPPVVATVFEDNACINTNSSNTNYPTYLNCDSYLTAFRNQLNSGYFTLTPKPYAESYPVESTSPSVGSTWTFDPIVFQADFSGTGTSTGDSADVVNTGAMGALVAGSGAHSCAIASSTPLASGSASYLECTIGTGSGVPGYIQMTPTSERTSWGRIFDLRTGQWLVNGAFDFFWRPTKPITASNAMRPIDISNGANGLRLVFDNSGGGLTFQVISPSGGGGINLISSPQTFTVGTTYHIGVTFSTNPTTGVTTEKMFLMTGAGAINTASTANLIGTSTFTLNPTVVTNTNGFLSNGPWNFGDAYGNGALNVNDYDGFRIYSQDPGSFAAL